MVCLICLSTIQYKKKLAHNWQNFLFHPVTHQISSTVVCGTANSFIMIFIACAGIGQPVVRNLTMTSTMEYEVTVVYRVCIGL